MKENLDYCEQFKNVNNSLDLAIEEMMCFWSPDPPPLLIYLANIGRWILDNFNTLNNKEKLYFFKIIEDGISSSDVDLSNAIATGLVEAIVNRVNNENFWLEISPYFQSETQNYAKEWYYQRWRLNS